MKQRSFGTVLVLMVLGSACGQEVRPYDENATMGAGGNGGSGEGGAGGNAEGGSSAGGGGSPATGGQRPEWCNAVGQPFDVFSEDDLEGASLKDRLTLVPDFANGGRVHVVVRGGDNKKIYLRTLVDAAAPNKNMQTYTSIGAAVEPWGGWLDADGNLLLGASSTTVGTLGFALDPDDGILAGGTLDLYENVEPECEAPNAIVDAKFTTSDQTRFILKCVPESGPAVAYFAYGNSVGRFASVEAEDTVDSLAPAAVVKAGGNTGTFFAVVRGKDDLVSRFSEGTDAGVLGNLNDFAISTEPGTENRLSTVLELPDKSGIVAFATHATADSTFDVWTGAAAPANFSLFGLHPPPTLQLVGTVKSASESTHLVDLLQNAAGDAIFGAGASLDGSSVLFSWFDGQGALLTLFQPIHEATNEVVVAARGAPFGDDHQLAIWIERDDAPPKSYRVRGQRLSCQEPK